MRSRIKRLLAHLSGLLARWSGEEVRVSRSVTYEANPLVTEVTLVLDRPRRLRFTMAEAVKFRRRTGISVWTGEGTPTGEGLDIGALDETELMELLAVCCEADDPGVTAEGLAPHLAGENLVDAVAALMVLISDFHPDVSEDVTANPLVASALLRLMSADTGRSRRRHSGSRTESTGGLPLA